MLQTQLEMKKYTYNLFPVQLIVLGYMLIIIGIVGGIYYFNSSLDKSFSLAIISILIGLVMVTYRTSITIDSLANVIVKNSRMFGFSLSNERVMIPKNCKGLVLKQRIKQGTGYYKTVIPMNYDVKSCDMFFYSDKGVVRLLNTDIHRAKIIADLISETLSISYSVE